jgi:hypothetical protein
MTIKEHDSPVKSMPKFENKQKRKLQEKTRTMAASKTFPELKEVAASDDEEVTYLEEVEAMED